MLFFWLLNYHKATNQYNTVFNATVYRYGNFTILIQSETFSTSQYPIHIQKVKIMASDI